jgi:hypothetical protein|tara:strand:- start:23280 stop:23420 length:141 start_codon:yes stop_codon:yes gene_type:complete
MAAKKKKQPKARNPVARHAHKFNKPAVHRDRKHYQRKPPAGDIEEQ